MKPLRIGRVDIRSVLEAADVPVPLPELLPTLDPAAVDAEAAWLLPRFARRSRSGRWQGLLTFQSYVVRTAHHNILVDACVGNDKNRNGAVGFHMLQTPWLENLRATGLGVDDIDFVMCTHMHADHIGWNTRLDNGRWVPTFPRARYLFARTEYEHRQANWERHGTTTEYAYEDSVLPVIASGQAVVVESDHVVDDQLRIESAAGHTPGNVVLRIRDGGDQAVLSGDVIHHPLQVKYPEWSSAYCEDPLASAACRRRFVEQHADTGTLILPAHFPAPTAGRIRRDGARWRFDFVA